MLKKSLNFEFMWRKETRGSFMLIMTWIDKLFAYIVIVIRLAQSYREHCRAVSSE